MSDIAPSTHDLIAQTETLLSAHIDNAERYLRRATTGEGNLGVAMVDGLLEERNYDLMQAGLMDDEGNLTLSTAEDVQTYIAETTQLCDQIVKLGMISGPGGRGFTKANQHFGEHGQIASALDNVRQSTALDEPAAPERQEARIEAMQEFKEVDQNLAGNAPRTDTPGPN